MKIFDNITEVVRDDLSVTIKRESSVSMAAACFSMYAYNELRKQPENVNEFRFIFTSPAFVKEKENKQKREFYIPASPVSIAFTVQNLRLSCATK